MRILLAGLAIYLCLSACNTGTEETRNTAGQREPFNRHAPLKLTRHARCRMDCRHITLNEIHEILDKGEINYRKSEPDARPDPKYAVEGYSQDHQHLRVIVAPEAQVLVVITCIELDVEWQCHCN